MKKIILLAFALFSFFTKADAQCSVNIIPLSTPVCAGDSVTLTASATGTPAFVYSWSGGATTSAIRVAAPGSFTVSITDGVSCTATSPSLVITVKPAPVISTTKDTCICFGDCISITASGGVSYSWCTGNTSTAIAICPSTTTSCTVIVGGANGCSASKAVTICVNPLPVVHVGPPVSVCKGDCAQLNASGGIKYMWSPAACLDYFSIPNPLFCCTNTTTFTVTVTDGNGCSVNEIETVTVNPLPTIDALNDICINLGGGVFLCTTGSGIAWSWSPSVGLSCSSCNCPIVVPTVTTDYVVTVIDVYGCVNSDTVTVGIAPCSIGIEEIPENNLSISPNPSANKFTIAFSKPMSNALLKLYNVMGEEVYFKTIDNRQETINTNLGSGVYFVKVSTEEKQFVQKIVVE